MRNLDSKKENNINSLCKKYFTPELCDEPVTESKKALKGKIYSQILKFGDYICNKNFSKYGGSDVLCNVVIDTIEECWKNWEKKSYGSYSAYFASALKNNVNNHLKSQKEKVNTDVVSSDSSRTPGTEENSDSIQSILDKEEALSKVEEYFRAIDVWFKIKNRSDWYKTLITGDLYEALHQYFDYFPERKISRFSFIDEIVYNLSRKPLKKEIATLLGKDEGQMTKARSKFYEELEILIKKEEEK